MLAGTCDLPVTERLVLGLLFFTAIFRTLPIGAGKICGMTGKKQGKHGGNLKVQFEWVPQGSPQKQYTAWRKVGLLNVHILMAGCIDFIICAPGMCILLPTFHYLFQGAYQGLKRS